MRRGPQVRHWLTGKPRGTPERFPMPYHRTMAEVMRDEKNRNRASFFRQFERMAKQLEGGSFK